MNKKPVKKAAKKGVKKPAKKAKKGAKKTAKKKARPVSFKKVNKKLKVMAKKKKTAIHKKNAKSASKIRSRVKVSRKPASRKPARKKISGKKPVMKNTVAVEEASAGKHFIVVLNGQRKMFSLSEMRILVAMSHSGSNDTKRGGEIFTWMKRNRQDVLMDTEIAAGGRPLFARLSDFLRKHYRVKKG